MDKECNCKGFIDINLKQNKPFVINPRNITPPVFCNCIKMVGGIYCDEDLKRECNFNGYFNETSGFCICYNGFKGIECEQKYDFFDNIKSSPYIIFVPIILITLIYKCFNYFRKWYCNYVIFKIPNDRDINKIYMKFFALILTDEFQKNLKHSKILLENGIEIKELLFEYT